MATFGTSHGYHCVLAKFCKFMPLSLILMETVLGQYVFFCLVRVSHTCAAYKLFVVHDNYFGNMIFCSTHITHSVAEICTYCTFITIEGLILQRIGYSFQLEEVYIY